MDIRALAVRLITTLLCLIAFLSLLHAVLYLMPGDPVRALFGLRSPGPELLGELRRVFHLDEPYPLQLWRYLSGLVTGDLGPVYRLSPSGLSATTSTVSGVIWAALPNTMRMVGLALLLQAVIGTALTVALSEVQGRRYLALKALVALVLAIPAFALAAVLAVTAPAFVEWANVLAGAACLAAVPSGMVALVGYPQMSESRHARFVLRARASGIREQRVRWLHSLRPSLGLMASLIAAETGTMLTAAILVEPVIGRHGIGAVLLNAVQTRQAPTVLAVVGFSFIIVAVMNLLADVVAVALDPRIRAL